MLETIDRDNIRELHLARPPVNALDPGLVSALRHVVEQAAKDDVDGLMLSGAPGCFPRGSTCPL